MAIDNNTLEALMHAFLDGQLSPNATKKIVTYLKEHPEKNKELNLNNKIKTYLHGAFNPILDIPISDRLQSILLGDQSMLASTAGVGINVDDIDIVLQDNEPSSTPNLGSVKIEKTSAPPRKTSSTIGEKFSAGLHNHSGHIVLISSLVFMIGLFIGYLYPRANEPDHISIPEFVETLALSAHLTYAGESNYSGQMKSKQIKSFADQYSEEFGVDVSPVNLANIGLELMGGNILPSLQEKAVFYMYQSVSNERLSIYIRLHANNKGTTGSNCYASPSDRLNICTWRGNKLTYFVVSDQPADTMNAIVQDISTRLLN